MMTRLRSVAAVAAAAGAGQALGQASFMDLGQGGAGNYSISGDGRTVIGGMLAGNIWSASAGFWSLPQYQGHGVGVSGVSYDGSTFVGSQQYWDEHQILQQRGVRWSQQSGFQVVTIFGQTRGVSYDGNVVG